VKESQLLILLLALCLIGAAYILLRYVQIRQRCVALRYSYSTMRSFAAKLVFKEDDFDHHWRDLVIEHEQFMKRFDTSPMNDRAVKDLEADLVRRGIRPLYQHER
jgi:hypothetical protein